MTIKKYIRYLFLISFFTFIFNKGYLRPWVLKSDLPQFFETLVYSLPNFIEAVLGTLILIGIALRLKERFSGQWSKLSDANIYLIVICFAGIYVVTQELKIHNLGGRNTYDPYDLLASIMGLIFIYMVVRTYGFLNKVG